ncbi:MAG: PAS domain S-box protein [Cyanobacteria bacterium CRU_2_1]|nr:PAS domain S-box protein [Cyanobacteria bacterium RU_5_0]NJR59920.1 PAS domain S-box protein [Cyanobacteria bacterium CRU_2_1]
MLFLAVAVFLLKREVTRRRCAEITLRQQTDRERLIHQIAQHIRESLNLDEVLATTVAEVRQFLGCDRVLIYRLWEDGTGSAITETVLPNYPIILGQSFPEEVFPREHHQAYCQGKVRTIADITQADVEPCLADFVKWFGVKAKLVVPILQERREDGQPSTPYLWGLLIAHHCSQPRQWQSIEIELMKQLATQVAIAIQQSELYEQLQLLNAQLEHRVQERTEALAQANVSLRAEIAERKRTEAALRHTNHTLESLIAASPRAIFTLDLNGNVKIWNPAAERMFGWTVAEVIDRPNLVIPVDQFEEYRVLQESILQGTTYPRLELQRPRKDGTAIDIILSAAPLLDSEGKICGMVAVIADITEQKRQEEQVRLLQSVVVNANDAVLITDAEPIDSPGPKIIYVNEAFTRMTGYTLDEVLGKTPRILHGEKTDRTQLDRIRSALIRWEAATVEVINYRKDGSEFWVEFSVVPVADKTGWYTNWVSVQRDISDRKHAEQTLRQSEARFRSLIENALDIITIMDADGMIRYASPSVEKVLGYSTASLIDRNFFEFVHPDDFVNTCYNITNAIQNPDTTLSTEFRCRHKDSSWRILEAISQRFIDYGEMSRIMVNCRDITARKRLDEMRLALDREKELSAIKTRFFSMASHEFRTPLSTILAAAQLLENRHDNADESEKTHRNLQRIQTSVKHMIQILDDILTINRAETGKLEFNPKLMDLEKFCQQIIEEARLTATPQHTIVFTSSGMSFNACLDEKLLRSILTNLLSNAIKYSPQGGTVSLTLKQNTDHANLCIQDQGIGIPIADQKQLFEPFHRGSNARKIPGTGLGLVVVKKCVDLHGGEIELDSTVGVGTMFTIMLPLNLPQ